MYQISKFLLSYLLEELKTLHTMQMCDSQLGWTAIAINIAGVMQGCVDWVNAACFHSSCILDQVEKHLRFFRKASDLLLLHSPYLVWLENGHTCLCGQVHYKSFIM